MDQFKDFVTCQRDKWKWERQKAFIKEAFFDTVSCLEEPKVIILEFDFILVDPGWIWAGFRSEVADETFIQIKNIQILSVYTGSKLANGHVCPSTRIELELFGSIG